MPRGTSAYDEARIQGRLWTPLSLGPALVEWWDPTSGVVSSSTGVSSWTGRVAGTAATQATTTTRPTYSAIARNRRPGLTFNGTSQCLSYTPPSSFPSGTAPSSIFAAFYCPTGTGSVYQVFNIGNNFNAVRGMAGRSGVLSAGIDNSDFNSTFSVQARDTAGLWLQSGTTATLYDNGSAGQSGTLSVNSDLAGGAIGRAPAVNGTTGEFFSQVIQQILVINRLLTPQEIAKVMGWESWVDGKAGSNLPASHPYRNRPPLVGN